MADSKAVQKHFDDLADRYDSLKKRNGYYYASLKKCVAEVVPPGKKVLEIGTATGEILNFLRPSKGVGIDLSPKMIEAPNKNREKCICCLPIRRSYMLVFWQVKPMCRDFFCFFICSLPKDCSGIR